MAASSAPESDGRSPSRLPWHQSLEPIVGSAGLQSWEDLDGAWRDRLLAAIAPGMEVSALVAPGTATELAAVVTWATENNWQILPCGNGSKLDWGGRVGNSDQSLLALSTHRINRLIEHAVGDLTVTVEAGMKFAELQSILGAAGQFWAIDPAYPDRATIGGILATGDTGSLRQRYNSVRDMVLGLSFVRADGQIAKAGGRVVKNVAGYDLMKLLTGSYGTLGIVTQVTLRVYPLPPASETVIFTGAATAIAQAAQTLRNSALTPTCADILSAGLMTELGLGQGLGLVVRFQGIAASVVEQRHRWLEVGQALGLIAHTLTDDAALWQRLRSPILPVPHSSSITAKIGIRPTDAVSLVQQVEALNFPHWYGQIHAGSGLGRLTILESPGIEALLKLRSLCQAGNGFCSILQAPASVKQQMDVWGYTGNALDLMRRIKQQFDPQFHLSPHRFVGNL